MGHDADPSARIMIWLSVFGGILTVLVVADQVMTVRLGRGGAESWLHSLLLLMVIAGTVWVISLWRSRLRRRINSFETLVEQMGEGIGIVDHEEVFVFANPAAERIFGVGSGELAGRSLSEFLDADSRRETQQRAARRRQGKSEVYELTINTGDGRRRYIRITENPEHDQRGEVTGTYGLIQDITIQREAAQALEISEKRYRNLVQRMSEGFAIVDPEECVTYANPAMEEIFGVELGTLAGRNLLDFIDEQNQPILAHQGELRREGKASSYELPVRRPDGELRLVYISCNPVFAADGKFAYSYGLVQDITERKLAEAELHQLNVELEQRVAQRTAELSRSEEFSRAALANSPLGISVRSRTGKLLSYNESWQRIWAYTNDDIAQDMARDRSELKFEDRDSYIGKWQPAVRNIYENGGSLHIPDMQVRSSRAGAAQWVSQYFYAIKDSAGSVDRVVIITEDITARKLAERALRESEERFRMLVETMPDGLGVQDTQERLIYVNQTMCRMLGYAQNELLGRHPQDFLDEANRQVLAQQTSRRRQSELGQYELIWRHQNGHPVHAMVSAAPLADSDGNFAGSFAVLTDITELKRNEETFRKHWRLLDGIATAANILVQSDSPEQALSECLAVLGHAAGSDRVRILARDADAATDLPEFQLHGEWARDGAVTAESTAGQAALSGLDDLPELYAALSQGRPVFRSASGEGEWPLAADGGVKSVLLLPVLLAHEFWGFISVEDCRAGRDWPDIEITTLMAAASSVGGFIAKARAETALRESEEAYRTLAGNLPGAVYRVLLQEDNRTLFFNDVVEAISGHAKESLFDGDPCSLAPLIHDDDRDSVIGAVKRAIKEGASFEIEYRLRHKNGSLRWLAENGKPIMDEAGRPLYIDGVIFDISERKRAEGERDQLITELRDAIAQITTLRGLLPICSYCKKIRDDSGYWNQIEAYLMKHSEAEFSHGICPDCAKEHFPEIKLHGGKPGKSD